MKRILLINLILTFCLSVNAQFNGPYAPASWTLSSALAPSNANVNTAGAPASIVLTGDNDCSGNTDQEVVYTTTIPFCGTLSFSYNFVDNDVSDQDEEFGCYVNAIYYPIEVGLSSNSGAFGPISVAAGDVFKLAIYSATDCNGTGVVTISNFSAPVSGTVLPTVPTLSATVNPTCLAGDPTNINITGSLNGATNWYLYSVSCGGVIENITPGTSFPVAPLVTTTYFVRGEGTCITPGSCGSITINVGDNVNPTITCPTNITQLVATPGDPTATVPSLGTPTTNDNCSVAAVINDHPSTTYPVGINNVTWTVTDGNGNTATCIQTVTILDNAGMEDLLGEELVLYPNPTSQSFKLNGQHDEIEIYNMIGELVLAQDYSENYSVGHLKNGLYHVVIRIGGKQVVTKLSIQ